MSARVSTPAVVPGGTAPRDLAHGDRVTAARDLDTTQGLHISQGAEGTVAEDRGSTLVVFFDDEGFAGQPDRT